MDKVLLCKCQSGIVADNVTEILEANGIASLRHDETDALCSGAYGPMPGIAIYVFAADLEKARTLAGPILDYPADTTKPFCPKCGSEDLVQIERSRFTTPMLILSIFLFIAPCVYLYFTMGSKDRPEAMDYLAVIIFMTSISIMVIGGRKNANLKCRHCGKKFNHI